MELLEPIDRTDHFLPGGRIEKIDLEWGCGTGSIDQANATSHKLGKNSQTTVAAAAHQFMIGKSGPQCTENPQRKRDLPSLPRGGFDKVGRDFANSFKPVFSRRFRHN